MRVGVATSCRPCTALLAESIALALEKSSSTFPWKPMAPPHRAQPTQGRQPPASISCDGAYDLLRPERPRPDPPKPTKPAPGRRWHWFRI